MESDLEKDLSSMRQEINPSVGKKFRYFLLLVGHYNCWHPSIPEAPFLPLELSTMVSENLLSSASSSSWILKARQLIEADCLSIHWNVHPLSVSPIEGPFLEHTHVHRIGRLSMADGLKWEMLALSNLI